MGARDAEGSGFDVFLCHNSKDKVVVRDLANKLAQRGIQVWFDEWEVRPGDVWQDAVAEGLLASRTVLVLFGSQGEGPWAIEERRVALHEATVGNKRAIPVLLPGVSDAPTLPAFMAQRRWVDCRLGFSDVGLANLLWGITGQRPAHVDTESRDPFESAAVQGPPVVEPDAEPAAHIEVAEQPAGSVERPRNDWQRVVALQVLATDGQWHVGTGYLLSPTRVLTARHAVVGKGWEPDKGAAIRVLLSRRQSEPSTVLEARIHPWQCANADVAVLEVQADSVRVEQPSVAGLFRQLSFQAGQAWSGQGYPKVQEQRTSLKLSSYIGKVLGCQGYRIELSVEPVAEHWSGFSGAPVFSGGSLVGVVRAMPYGFDGAKLEATSLEPLLREPAFCTAIGLVSLSEQRGKRMEQVVATLKQGQGAAELRYAFQAALQNNGSPNMSSSAEEIADAMLALGESGEQGARTLSEVLMDVATALEKSKFKAVGNGRHPVLEIMCITLPHAESSRVLVPKVVNGVQLFELSTWTHLFVESGLANFDKRKLEVSIQQNKVRGQRAVLVGPDPGMGSAQALDQAVQYLAEHILDVDDPDPERRLVDVQEALLQEADDHRAGRDASPPYIIVEHNPSEPEPLLLQEIRSRLPQLRVVVLAVDKALAGREVAVERNLKRLLKGLK